MQKKEKGFFVILDSKANFQKPIELRKQQTQTGNHCISHTKLFKNCKTFRTKPLNLQFLKYIICLNIGCSHLHIYKQLPERLIQSIKTRGMCMWVHCEQILLALLRGWETIFLWKYMYVILNVFVLVPKLLLLLKIKVSSSFLFLLFK